MTRGTSRIRPPHVGAAIDRYPPHAGPTAANLQQRVCCSAPALGQTDGRTDGHRAVHRPCCAHYANIANNCGMQKLEDTRYQRLQSYFE